MALVAPRVFGVDLLSNRRCEVQLLCAAGQHTRVFGVCGCTGSKYQTCSLERSLKDKRLRLWWTLDSFWFCLEQKTLFRENKLSDGPSDSLSFSSAGVSVNCFSLSQFIRPSTRGRVAGQWAKEGLQTSLCPAALPSSSWGPRGVPRPDDTYHPS